jgi:hypothetical protein
MSNNQYAMYEDMYFGYEVHFNRKPAKKSRKKDYKQYKENKLI